MKNREVIYRSLDLIEENLKSDMTVFALSRYFDFSLFYFSRIFNGITGFTPKAYMLNRKISEAAKEIVAGEKKIIEIAFDYGFSTPESFSRAFQKIAGDNPSVYRKQKLFSQKEIFPRLSRESIESNKFLEQQEGELVEREPILLVGIPFFYDISMKNDLSLPWSNMTKNINLVKERIVPEKYYQVQYWFEDQDPGTLFFFVAAEVSKIDDIPIQFTAKVLPRQTYLRFYHKGRANSVGIIYRYIYETFLPDTEYRLPYLYNFEQYGDKTLEPDNEESISEIYIPVGL
ncbi:MAG: AraC family transcriptional regulator [Spirochaetes bacterium]|nr:AraC family transcriptional regulator [Spirochaetota bacterium]MBN2769450.1 AraC family transcriptional regulator [Spirochaetota bacterium]